MHGLDDEVGAGGGPPAEASPEEQRVDAHLLGREPGDGGRVGAVHRLELGTGPDVALVRAERHQTVQGLHRGVRQVGHLVGRLDPRGRPGKGGARIALPLGGQARRRGQLGIRRLLGGGVDARALALLPDDLEGIAALLGRPERGGDHRHARRDLDDLLDSAHRPGARRVRRS